MSSHFKKIELKDNECGYLIISTCIFSPQNYIRTIEIELKKSKYNGPIIFDLLLCEEFEKRFYSAYFDGKSLDIANILPVTFILSELKEICENFHEKNRT